MTASVTIEQRQQAQEILRRAGAYHEAKRKELSARIGICADHLWRILKMPKTPTGRYAGRPEYVIKVLQWNGKKASGEK